MLRVQYDLSQESEPRAPNPSVPPHVELSPGYHSHWVLHPRLQLDCFFEASAWFELGHVEQAPATAHDDDDDDDDGDDDDDDDGDGDYDDANANLLLMLSFGQSRTS